MGPKALLTLPGHEIAKQPVLILPSSLHEDSSVSPGPWHFSPALEGGQKVIFPSCIACLDEGAWWSCKRVVPAPKSSFLLLKAAAHMKLEEKPPMLFLLPLWCCELTCQHTVKAIVRVLKNKYRVHHITHKTKSSSLLWKEILSSVSGLGLVSLLLVKGENNLYERINRTPSPEESYSVVPPCLFRKSLIFH